MFPTPDSVGNVWVGVGRALVQFMYALFSHFCHVGGFGDLGKPMLPYLRGAGGDVVTVYAYQDTNGRFLQSVALPRAGQNPCQRREMTVSTNNGLHE